MESIKEIQKQKDIIASRPYTIAVDLDGVLAEQPIEWKGNLHIGKPVKKYIKLLKYHKQANTKIIIHTARVTSWDEKTLLKSSVYNVKKWLKKNKVPYDIIWTSPGKPFANEYWDDRAVWIERTWEK